MKNFIFCETLPKITIIIEEKYFRVNQSHFMNIFRKQPILKMAVI